MGRLSPRHTAPAEPCNYGIGDLVG